MVELRYFDEGLQAFFKLLLPVVKRQYPADYEQQGVSWVEEGYDEQARAASLLTCDKLKVFLHRYAAEYHLF